MDDIVKETILEYYKTGQRAGDIASLDCFVKLGIGKEDIQRAIADLKEQGRIPYTKNDIAHQKREVKKKKVLELYKKGYNVTQMAQKLNTCQSSITVICNELAIEGKIEDTIGGAIRKKKERNKQITLQMLLDNKSDSEIAKTIGVSVSAISNYKKELVDEGKIAANYKKNITEKSKTRILTALQNGRSRAEIAKSINIPLKTLDDLIKELKEEARFVRVYKKDMPKTKSQKVNRKKYDRLIEKIKEYEDLSKEEYEFIVQQSKILIEQGKFDKENLGILRSIIIENLKLTVPNILVMLEAYDQFSLVQESIVFLNEAKGCLSTNVLTTKQIIEKELSKLKAKRIENMIQSEYLKLIKYMPADIVVKNLADEYNLKESDIRKICSSIKQVDLKTEEKIEPEK